MTSHLQIVAAAIKDDTGKIWSLPPPNRHHNILQLMFKRAKSTLDDQGFLLNNGHWVSRKAAATIALANGQATSLMSPPNLYSEDLW